MNIVFRTDASLDIGTGHIMRCLVLAEALREKGAICSFVCREHVGNLIELIRQRGFIVHNLPMQPAATIKIDISDKTILSHASWLGADLKSDAEQTKVAIGDTTIDWLIVDHYALDYRWETELKSHFRKLMVIDDLADREHECNLLLDQNWFGEEIEMRYKRLVPATCKTILGPKYALLGPEYEQLRAEMPPRSNIIRRVLVFLGGSDPSNQTAKVVRALTHHSLMKLAVDVVIGVNHPSLASIQALAAQRIETSVHQGVPSLGKLMVQADLMISAGGSTGWERMCLGLPAIVISVADNQTATNLALMKAGYINFLGHMNHICISDIRIMIKNCLLDIGKMNRQTLMGQQLVDGMGVANVIGCIMGNDV
ncbi:MAG: UDP-2,4-diacetamido-2,4,6-trideoxy-beta-L-altropyranose hydrolase [Bdellovibrionales bacterium]|jgi:UDP-2,4-diacetamido-2,4,6-trideoxy-beta-L-altropyranose hydrolase|nr:UDP-2,4-diacetamido-2,4,6-trideoxy-beta-L-altropyranose hydrolase [Bdellovibrionales bacterium]MBT3525231.1 UDP-2,4-diacetamido-2,4,6-trideoxy-beta-L-altropyranose hydrolase [Bdellovibrionales bacterium]MBT7669010.1 UDP-2,4-diacetamido-2,4,6-trideoxy-beta-L-altropyranose hydrolase [Bdellovibrionales bacterium]